MTDQAHPLIEVKAEEFAALFDHLYESVIVVDRASRIYYANRSFQALTDLSLDAISTHELAKDYIELPGECWRHLDAGAAPEGESELSTEVGFITRSGTMGRAQVVTGQLPGESEAFYLIFQDVTVEARLHAKYKVVTESNQHLIATCKRLAHESALFLRLANEWSFCHNKQEIFD